MNPAQKALWFIESHLADELTLDEIAAIGGISRFHMVRAFAAATGLSVMRYVRARRLTEAARALANGAPDILGLALDADYGSHEAFTRPFRDHFGVTPRLLRPAARIRPRADTGSEIRGVHPPRSHLEHPTDRQHDLESLAAVVGTESGRCAQLRALRRKLRSADREWRAGDLDTGQGVSV